MWFFIGLIRSTLLYSFIGSLLSGELSINLIAFYAMSLGLHALICKFSDGREPSDILIGAIEHDAVAPFLGVKALIQLLLHKYLTNRHEPHAAFFLTQGVVEGLWGTMLLAYLAFTILQRL